jgi:hypothetical protein
MFIASNLLLGCAALALAGCTSAPPELEAARVWAWERHGYHSTPGDWAVDPSGDCKNKALAIGERLTARGYRVEYLVGCRTDLPGCDLHMVPAARRDGRWHVIDADRVFDRASYPWRPMFYDVAARIGRDDQNATAQGAQPSAAGCARKASRAAMAASALTGKCTKAPGWASSAAGIQEDGG